MVRFLARRGKTRGGRGVLSALLAIPLALGLSGFAAKPAAAGPAPVTTVTTTTTYDDFGNPTNITATTAGGGETFVTTTVNTYTNDTAKWHLGRLTRAEVTNTLPDLSTATRVSEFAYDAASGLLTQEVIEPGTALALTTTYTHDAFGNRLSATLSGSDIVSRTTSTTYTADGRFATGATNALDHSETRTYDTRFGEMTSLTGPNNLTTTWEFDGFARQTREARADGTETTWSYNFCDAACPSAAVYFVETRQLITSSGDDYAARSRVYFDRLNREIRRESEGFDATPVYSDTEYNALGQVTRSSRPYFDGTPAQDIQWTLVAYDAIGRASTTTAPDGGVSTVTYNGLITTTTNALNQDAIETKNVLGQVVETRDHLGGSNTYFYDHFGNLEETLDAAGNQAFMTYDIRGHKIDMDDPDMGVWSYAYNVLGELISQTDAKLQTVTMAYDKLGRLVSRTEAEGTTTWTYDTATTGVGKLHQVSGPGGYLSVASYDSLGRPSGTSETIGGEVFTTAVTYDAAGRVATQSYPTGFTVERSYTLTGFLEEVRDLASATVYWTANDVNAEGQVTEELLGNGLVTQRAFDPETGLVETIQTWNGLTPVQDDGFDFDFLGNLTQRIDAIQGRQEDFLYDGLNRLTDSTLIDSASLQVLNTTTLDYDAVGNITAKSDVGNYTYTGAGGPHAVSGVSGGPAGTLAYTYDANGNMTAGAGRTLAWSSFNKPTYIDGGAILTFTYGPGRARILQVATTGSGTKTIKYVGALYEKQVTGGNPAEHVHYIRAAGTVAIYTEVEDANPATDKTRYLHRDHLGSIVALTDEAGQVAERLSFDPHGQRRLTDWLPAPFPLSGQETPRGFTGHEHLDGVGLIHMNGRVYDPLLGRFLSADPIVQFPKSTQGLNRYTYTNNNPLSFTDPSGFFSLGFIGDIFDSVGDAIGDIVGGVADAVGSALSNQYVRIGVAIAAGAITWGLVSGAIVSNAYWSAYYATGGIIKAAVSAAYTAASSISTAVISGAAAGFVGGVVASAGDIKSAAIGALSGGAFGFVGASGVFGQVGKITAGRVLGHGLIGGTASVLRGGKFATGFVTGAFSKIATPFSNAIAQGNAIAGAMSQAVVGGVTSVLGGGKFANGAITSAFAYLFNEAATSRREEILKKLREISIIDKIREGQNFGGKVGGETMFLLIGEGSSIFIAGDTNTRACIVTSECTLFGLGAGVNVHAGPQIGSGVLGEPGDKNLSFALFGGFIPKVGPLLDIISIDTDGSISSNVNIGTGLFFGGGVKMCENTVRACVGPN